MKKIILSFDEITDIINFYNSTKSLRETSAKFNISMSSIRRLLISNEVETSIDKDAQRKRKIKYEIDENYFGKIDSSDKAYILGILFSDGHISKNRKQIRLKLSDIDLLDEIKSRMNYNKPYNTTKKYKDIHKKLELLTICNTKVYDDLVKLGCVQNKTFNCHLPNIDSNFMPDFIRGFFDGDGSIWIDSNFTGLKRDADVNIVSTKEFCEELKSYLYVNHKIESFLRKDKRQDDRIRILRIKNVNSLIGFYNLIYSNISGKIFLKRKYNKFKEYLLHRKEYRKI